MSAVPLEDHKAALARADELLEALLDATDGGITHSSGRTGVMARCDFCLAGGRGADADEAQDRIEHASKCPLAVADKYRR